MHVAALDYALNQAVAKMVVELDRNAVPAEGRSPTKVTVRLFADSAERLGFNAVRVMSLLLRPYASPAWAKQHRGGFLQAEPAQGFIQHTTVPEAWTPWFAAGGVALSSSHQAPRYDLMSMALNASAAGLGAVLLPDFMVGYALASREVVRLSPRAWMSERADHLICPVNLADHTPLRVFRLWLMAQVTQYEESQS